MAILLLLAASLLTATAEQSLTDGRRLRTVEERPHAKRRGGRRRWARSQRREDVAAVRPLLFNESIDPLGYYIYAWAPPKDACGTEMHADYDGLRAFNWGPSTKKRDAGECCDMCQAHSTCNSWVFCPDPVCYAPDATKHTLGECWMKLQRDPSSPSVNMRGEYSSKYRARPGHHHAPLRVQWISGTIRLTRPATNGTWSSRAVW
jgi:hypothetical protein